MPDDVKPLPSQGNQTANARRKYLHVLQGGALKPHDLSRIVADMEAQDARVAALEADNAKLREALERVSDLQERARSEHDDGGAIVMIGHVVSKALSAPSNVRITGPKGRRRDQGSP